MKILFLNKDAKKPKSLSFYSLCVLITIIFAVGFASASTLFIFQQIEETLTLICMSEVNLKRYPSSQELQL